MKLAEDTFKMEHYGNVEESASFHIEASAHAHIMDILQDRLYANKRLAVVREYMANARDAHVAAGKQSTPFDAWIDVHEGGASFCVRDYGTGMTHHEVMRVFTGLGRSTKQQSDGFTGGFGIGAKSALGYAEAFFLESINGGVLRRYSITKQGRGVSEMSLMSARPSDEPSGVKVSIPIQSTDHKVFRSYLLRCAVPYDPPPNLKDAALERSLRETRLLGDQFFLYGEEGGSSWVCVGDILYPSLRAMPFRSLVPRIPISEIEVLPSREAIADTEANKEAIKRHSSRAYEAARLRVREVITQYPEGSWERGKVIVWLHRTFACPLGAGTSATVDVLANRGRPYDSTLSVPALGGKEEELKLVAELRWGGHIRKRSLRRDELLDVSRLRVVFDDVPKAHLRPLFSELETLFVSTTEPRRAWDRTGIEQLWAETAAGSGPVHDRLFLLNMIGVPMYWASDLVHRPAKKPRAPRATTPRTHHGTPKAKGPYYARWKADEAVVPNDKCVVVPRHFADWTHVDRLLDLLPEMEEPMFIMRRKWKEGHAHDALAASQAMTLYEWVLRAQNALRERFPDADSTHTLPLTGRIGSDVAKHLAETLANLPKCYDDYSWRPNAARVAELLLLTEEQATERKKVARVLRYPEYVGHELGGRVGLCSSFSPFDGTFDVIAAVMACPTLAAAKELRHIVHTVVPTLLSDYQEK